MMTQLISRGRQPEQVSISFYKFQKLIEIYSF
jgi:hypothetical protein